MSKKSLATQAYNQLREDTVRKEYEVFRDGGIIFPQPDCYEGRIRMEKVQGTVRGTDEPCGL